MKSKPKFESNLQKDNQIAYKKEIKIQSRSSKYPQKRKFLDKTNQSTYKKENLKSKVEVNYKIKPKLKVN